MPQARRKPERTPTPPAKLVEAQAYEETIRAEAEQIWGGEDQALSAMLFRKLYPLLRRPIHEGHIEHVSAGDGKPYDSTGIRSVQVQHNRMNSVLTPIHWHEVVEYEQGGKLCLVTVRVYDGAGATLMQRSSYGGVDRGSTIGNVYKGSYTNAAKPAFARIGPGHEIYVGAVDLDPDVSEEAARAQAKPDPLPGVQTVDADTALSIKEQFDTVVKVRTDKGEHEQFMAAFKQQAGELGISAGAKFSSLTPAQAADLSTWLEKQGGES